MSSFFLSRVNVLFGGVIPYCATPQSFPRSDDAKKSAKEAAFVMTVLRGGWTTLSAPLSSEKKRAHPS
jgi:hypothetical protein